MRINIRYKDNEKGMLKVKWNTLLLLVSSGNKLFENSIIALFIRPDIYIARRCSPLSMSIVGSLLRVSSL